MNGQEGKNYYVLRLKVYTHLSHFGLFWA